MAGRFGNTIFCPAELNARTRLTSYNPKHYGVGSRTPQPQQKRWCVLVEQIQDPSDIIELGIVKAVGDHAGRRWLDAPTIAALAKPRPVRAVYAYMDHLGVWGLVHPRKPLGDSILWSISQCGRDRLGWLRAQEKRSRLLRPLTYVRFWLSGPFAGPPCLRLSPGRDPAKASDCRSCPTGAKPLSKHW